MDPHHHPHEVLSLSQLASTNIAIHLFKCNIRWRTIKDVAYALGDELADWRLPPRVRQSIGAALAEVLRDVRRWDEKHKEMFPESPKKGRALDRCEHLRTFYSNLVWNTASCSVDDRATAEHLVFSQCADWPLMQFQFACCYALLEVLDDDYKFDKYRRITFRKQLADHPVYDFWLTLMEGNCDWELFFDTETRLADQRLQLCLKFAITHGYCELMMFIWDKIGDNTKEYIGLLQWRAMCLRARDGATMRFLCAKLCAMNANGVARISWTAFWSTFHNMMNDEESDVVVAQKFRRRFEFLLSNCCPLLRRKLLSMENFRVLSDAFRYNCTDTFSLLMEHLDAEQMRSAREVLDRIHDRRQSVEGARMRRTFIRRQLTTTD